MTNTFPTPLGNFVEPALISTRLDATYYTPAAIQAEHKLIDGQQLGIYDVMPLETISSYIMDFQAFSIYNFVEFSETYKEGWVEFLRVQDLQRGYVDTSKVLWTSLESHNLMRKSQVLPGDILLSIIGTLGVAARWTKSHECNSNQCIAKIRLKPNYDPGYVIAALNSPTMQILIHRDATGTVQKGLSLGGTRRLRLPIPDPKIQAYIGDKVRLAEKCREEANRLWDEAKQLLANTIGLPLSAEAYQSYNLNEIQSDNYQAVSKTPVICWVHQSIVDDRLGAQFFHPRRENIILKLRDTCELKKLSEVAVRVTKRISAEKAAHLGYVGLSEIDSANGFFEPIPMEKAETVGVSSYFGSGDILFSKLRPYLNKVTICPDHIKEACGSTELLVYRAKRNVHPYYLFFILKSSLGLFQIIDLTTGSTLPRVDPEIIDDLLIPLLTEQIQEEIDRKVRKTFYLLHTARNLINQSQSDVEALIENRLPVDQILAGILRSPNFDEILTKCSLE